MDIKNIKVGDVVQAFEADAKSEEPANLPKPTHYPHLEPQTVYGIVLHDPNLRIIPAGFPERKLH